MTCLQPEDLLDPDEAFCLETLKQRKQKVVERIKQLEAKLSNAQREIESMGVDNLDVPEAFDDPKNIIRAFNKRPKDTVEKLIAAGIFLSSDPKAIANYLWETQGLSKKSIGDFLTGDSDFEQSVLSEYIIVQGIAQADVLTALRMFLNSFQMSGEGQIVDRVMMKFAECYCKINESSTIFTHPDQCHIFLYAVMLLQTSLHNPNVKSRMKSAEFVKLCECCELPKEFLIKTYNDVKKRPFEHDNIAAATRSCLIRHSAKKGFLDKQSSHYWAWKRRFFVLMDHCLFYFEDSNCSIPRGIIPLENIRARKITDAVQHPHCMELFSITSDSMIVCKIEASGSVPKSTHSNIRLAADSDEDLQQWISAIEQSSWMNEYNELIQLQSNRLHPK